MPSTTLRSQIIYVTATSNKDLLLAMIDFIDQNFSLVSVTVEYTDTGILLTAWMQRQGIGLYEIAGEKPN